ncbi:MAG: SpoIIE family protein phosphatase [Bacteroidetes bacterium]|nr:SpoIIE family protein phosphatase [Bacteroidota bacterium]
MKYAVRILLLTILFTPAYSQKIPFANYTVQNGLPQSTVHTIVQDIEGYIWFATQVGVARWDGYKFEYFNVSSGLVDGFVNCMMVDAAGQIWFGTEGGISVYDGSGFRSYTMAEGLVDNKIDLLLGDEKGNIWAGSTYGLSVITPDTILAYEKGEELTDYSIKEMFLDSKGRVHIATYPFPGLTIFDNPYTYTKHEEEEVIWDIIEVPNGDIWYATQGLGIRINTGEEARWLGSEQGLSDGNVLSLMVDHEGEVWCGTYAEGLFKLDGDRFRKISLGNIQPAVSEIFEDRNHRVWVRTFNEDGVWLFDEGNIKLISSLNGLVDNRVSDIVEDSFGNIWMATDGGASKYGRVIFEISDMETGMPDNDVSAVFFDSKERIWCGNPDNLLYIRHGRIYKLGEQKGFSTEATPQSFAEDNNGNIFIGSDLGLWYYNGRSVQPVIYTDENENSRQFLSLLYTEDNTLWCATDSGLIVLKDGKEFIPPGMGQALDHYVTDLERVGDRIFCSTEGGISVFDMQGNHLKNFTMEDGLSSNVCIDLVSDFEGNLWIATDRGLSCMSTGENYEIERLGIEHGLASNTTYFVEFADSCSLWIGTERGLRKLDIISRTARYYGSSDGFTPVEPNARAVSRGKGSDLWIGTVKGLVHYLPEYDRIDLISPRLIHHPPVIDGKPYQRDSDDSDGIPSFPYNQNSLEFSFTGIHTTIPDKNSFSFMLDGFDNSWSSPGKNQPPPYKKLPNGNYLFKVRAFNLDGIGTEEEINFAFSIQPPFWRTFWFILFEVLAGLGLIYGTVKYRERQLIKDKRILEVKVKKRTREIEEQKVEIEAQRDEIVGQNTAITDSILYARRIQHAVLPGKLALEKSLPEHFVLLKPRDIVSGDFYWVEQKNDRVIVCAADCTGHGVPGAFMSLLGLTFLNEIVNKDEILKAAEILDRLRSYIINAMSHKDSQAKDGMDLSLIVLDRQLSLMDYAGAYNPLIMIRNGEMLEYKADKMPVGKHVGEEPPFSNHRIQLQKGDVIYLFSDGFPDQFGGEKGGKYKSRHFKRLLQSISSEPMIRQEELLEKELKEWMGDNEQVDDILVMGIRYE